MAAKNATNGFLRMAGGDTFTSPTPYGEFQPRALMWAGGTVANQKGVITDAQGITVCYMSITGPGDHVVLDGHFWGESRPWKTPITFTASAGMLLIVT